MIKTLTKRFGELTIQLEQLEATRQSKHSQYTGAYEEVDSELLLNWCVKARSLLTTACGKDGEHFKSFIESEKPRAYLGSYDVFKRVKAVFLASKEDFEGGYLVSVRNLVQAELAGSELDQARELLDSGYGSAAAVIAGVVLETTLRTLCDRRGLAVGKLDKMNADLAKDGEYNSLILKKITALAAIRNSAAHGKTSEFSVDDVKAMITEVERFAGDAFS